MRYLRSVCLLFVILAVTLAGIGLAEENVRVIDKNGRKVKLVKRKQVSDNLKGSFLYPVRKFSVKKQETAKSSFPDESLTNDKMETSNRESRFLSLFTVVGFRNQGCAASSGDNGTCLTSAECGERGGVASGPCAKGFGVCCVFLATCGQSTRENCTYFVNSNYPQPFDGTDSCQLTIHKSSPDICQFRLEFDQFNIAGPEPVNNICNTDQFIVSGGNPIPGICGYNNGNHMYIDAGNGITNPVTLTFVTSGPSFPRTWKVKVCQIPCDSPIKANPNKTELMLAREERCVAWRPNFVLTEEGCLQYFTGVSGQIRSYNYDTTGGLQLSNQDYSICIRSERNFCGIQYSPCPDTANNQSRAFTLSGNTLGQNQVAAIVGTAGPQSCNSDWLIIPCASNVDRVNDIPYACVDRICGGTFNSEVSLNPSTVYSTVKPFRLVYHTNGVEYPNDVANRGFCLNYVQQPCTNLLNRSRFRYSWGRK